MKRVVLFSVMLIAAGSVYGQKHPERRFVRSGNSSYERGDYSGSEISYLRALQKDSTSYEASFNYANSLYKQEKFQEAAQVYGKLSADSLDASRLASSSYNKGNALFKQRQLEQALEAYKSAMRANPNDREAKFNYAYTKKLIEDQKNEDKDNKDDQNKDDKQDQQNDQGQDKNKEQDGKDDPKDQNEDKNKGDSQQDKQQPKPYGMDKSQADQMLNAVQMNEDKTREKLSEQNAQAAGSGSIKNW